MARIAAPTDERVLAPTPAGLPIDFEGPSVAPLDGDPGLEWGPRYLKLLLLLLVSAAFFEGYDSSILALLLPNIQSTFHVSEAVLGITRIPIELGLFVAFFVARLSDRLGRRPTLLWSVVGYTVFTALTALSWDIWSFALFQFASRIFLGAEYAIGVTMIVEEFPVARRARALGTLLTFSALGTIVVGILLGAGLQDGPLEWRAFYLVGLAPLLVLSVFRRRLRETRRFEAVKAGRIHEERKPSMLEPWRTSSRRNILLVGLMHMLRSIPLYGSTAWWAFYAERERGFTSAEVAVFIICAYGLGCLGYYVCGRAMERWGRRPTAMVYFSGGIAFSILLFQVSSKPVSFVALLLAVFFGLGMGPVMSAFATELFPTELRGQAAAWIRNVFEIAGYVFGPALVGILGDHATGAVGNVGDTVSLLMLLQLPTLWLVWRYVPETKGQDLADAAA
ncbi:MAG: transporter permease [Acidimicrobiales bacterium]|nr:transporter permease [Acidimicrobiales bacterium]